MHISTCQYVCPSLHFSECLLLCGALTQSVLQLFKWIFIHLSPGKPAEDEVKLGSLKLKPNTKIMMMGTREESLVGN